MCQVWSCIPYNDYGFVIYSQDYAEYIARRMGGIDVGIA